MRAKSWNIIKRGIYLLLCDQKTFYVGISNNVAKRLSEHRAKKLFFTKKFCDIQLIYCKQYLNKYQAAMREKQLKGWSRRKKQMLVDGKLGYSNCTDLVGVLSGDEGLS
ncbi:MAG: hypothetical protein RIQ54_176 [Candidatus Parcubacteria bacterium]